MKKILVVFGTRPEAIKMAPLVKEFKKNGNHFQTLVCVTGQHRKLLDQVLKLFEIKADYDLNIMKKGQDLFDITSRVILGMRKILKEVNPDLVLVHGDTTTSFATALSAYYLQIPVGHVEAGLRTFNIYSPWPEEMNRLINSKISEFHFAPTKNSKNNLVSEGINNKKIWITGNTGIDALFYINQKIQNNNSITSRIRRSLAKSGCNLSMIDNNKIVLITGHRRENFGQGFLNICEAIKLLTKLFPNVYFIYPMHLNPNVRGPIIKIFGENNYDNLSLIEPLEYLQFVYLMSKSYIVLTDSGGIQEEAPSFGIPVLVMRETTERPEAVDSGTVKLVGTDKQKIITEVSSLLKDTIYYEEMGNAVNPYGDGYASKRILDVLIKAL